MDREFNEWSSSSFIIRKQSEMFAYFDALCTSIDTVKGNWRQVCIIASIHDPALEVNYTICFY